MANKKRIITIAAIVVALLGVSVGTFFLLYQPEPEGIIVGITTLPDSLNPVLQQNQTGMNASELVFDGLVNFEVDPQSQQMVSEFALADSITQDPVSKKTYTVTLKDLNWHDGRKFSAEDVVFSFEAYMNPVNESPKKSYLESFIESVTAIDEQTVQLEFRKPIPEFRAYPVLTFKIIPAYYKGEKLSTDLRSGDLEREFAIAPVGTGPFSVGDWEIGKWLTFNANPNYFRKVPGAETLVLRNIIDPVIRMNEFQKRNINLILETSPLDREEVEKMSEVHISSYLPYAFYQVTFNTKAAALASTDVRRALASQIDPSKLLPGITDREGLALVNYGPFPANLFQKNFPEYNVEPLPNLWDKNEADRKALVQDAGLADTSLSLLFPDSMGEFGQMTADAVAEQLGALGIKVEVKRTGDQVFQRLVYIEKDFDMALQYLEGFDNVYSDLDKYYRSGSDLNVSALANPDLDALFDTWNSTVVAADWIDVTRKLHAKITSLAPAIPLFSLQKDVYSRGINNIIIASDNPFLSAEDWAQAVK